MYPYLNGKRFNGIEFFSHRGWSSLVYPWWKLNRLSPTLEVLLLRGKSIVISWFGAIFWDNVAKTTINNPICEIGSSSQLLGSPSWFEVGIPQGRTHWSMRFPSHGVTPFPHPFISMLFSGFSWNRPSSYWVIPISGNLHMVSYGFMYPLFCFGI